MCSTDHRCVQSVQPSFLHFFEFQVGQKYNCLEFHPTAVKDTKKNLPRLRTRHEEEGEKRQNSLDQNLGVGKNKCDPGGVVNPQAHRYKRKGKLERTG